MTGAEAQNKPNRLVSEKQLKAILKEVGVQKISKEAVVLFKQKLEEIVRQKAEVIKKAAENSKRKTVKPEDVELAFSC